MPAKIQAIFYSMYGHIYKMAEAIAAGAREVEGAQVDIYLVAELVPESTLGRMGAKAARQVFAHIPLAKVERLPEADAMLFGTPTRFGNMCAQMRNYLDQTGKLWLRGSLIGKVGSVFTSTATHHGARKPLLQASTQRYSTRAWLLWGCLTQSRVCST